MQFDYIDEALRKEWKDLVKSNPASGYMQSFFWTEFQNMLGWTSYKIGIFDDKKLVGGAIVSKFPFSKNTNILFIPEGPVLPYHLSECEELFHALMAEVDKVADLKGNVLTSHLRIE